MTDATKDRPDWAGRKGVVLANFGVSILALGVSFLALTPNAYVFLGAETPGETAKKHELIADFVADYASGDPSRIRRSRSRTAPGSDAERFADSWQLLWQTWHAQNPKESFAPPTLKWRGDFALDVCTKGEENDCDRVDDFQLNSHGRIVDFSVDGERVGTLVAEESRVSSSYGVSVQVRAARVFPDGKFSHVVFNVQNTGAPGRAERYLLLATNGRRYEATNPSGRARRFENWQTRDIYLSFGSRQIQQGWVGVEFRRGTAPSQIVWGRLGW